MLLVCNPDEKNFTKKIKQPDWEGAGIIHDLNKLFTGVCRTRGYIKMMGI